MTGELADLYTLTNRGRAGCTLAGYPDVALLAASGAPLPFRYRRGGGPYVTSAPPVSVVLPSGAAAYVLVAKYRCDLGIRTVATAIRVTLPIPGRTPVTIRPIAAGGAGSFPYCRGGSGDPGQVVSVFPVEATVSATSSAGGPPVTG
jgi:hypothetical protein